MKCLTTHLFSINQIAPCSLRKRALFNRWRKIKKFVVSSSSPLFFGLPAESSPDTKGLDYLSTLRTRRVPRQHLFKSFIALFLLSIYTHPVYAIPPPETLAFLGGSLIYSGLLIIGLTSIVFKYIWIKTKLYMLWRLYLPWVVLILMLSICSLGCLIMSPMAIHNTPVDVQTITHWKAINSQFVFIDLRDSGEYDKIHIARSLNFPSGIGLNEYLKGNLDKKIILYCDSGFKSATLNGLDTDQNLLKQIRKEHRLFYFPDGLYQLMKLGDHSPIPVVINVPWKYAHYLSGKTPFVLFKFQDNNQAILEYQQMIAKQRVPIMNSTQSHDVLAEQLSNQFNVTHSYFTSNKKIDSFPLAFFLMVLGFLFALMFFIRRKELLQSLFAQKSIIYQWIEILLSFMMTIPTIAFSMQLTVPFDIYLYKITPDLPMNAAYFISIYALFGLILGVHLIYPKKKRLEFLQYQIKSIFAPTKSKPRIRQVSWKTIFIPSACLYLLYLIPFPVSSLLIISIFLSIPLVVDLLLHAVIYQYDNSDEHAFNIVQQCHHDYAPKGTPFIQINTCSPYSLGTMKMSIENQSIYLGLFTGLMIDHNKSSQNTLFQKNYNLNEEKLAHYVPFIRNLLILFQQDMELIFDKEHHIISITLRHNHNDSRVLNRLILLKHHQILPGVLHEQRFTSLPLQETFKNPTPLLLSILKKRWSSEGGCLKALRKLGLFSQKKDIIQEQFIAFCDQIYIDNAFEQAIFSSNKLLVWIRKKVVQLQFNLATESILQDFHLLIAPKAQIRIMKLTQYVDKPLSAQQLHRMIKCSIKGLYKESAMWQFYSSLLHQNAFRQLQSTTKSTSCDMPELLYPSFGTLPSLAIPSYYELSDQSNFTIDLKQKNHLNIHDAFLSTEYVRTRLRQLQLREWHLINVLLEKLTQQLALPKSLSYLTVDELCSPPKKRSALIDRLEDRYAEWVLQNEYQLPHAFSLQEIEQSSLNTTEHITNMTPSYSAIRVAGNQSICAGTAVVFKEGLDIQSLEKCCILIADNLLPEHIISCQHIKGIILNKGGYLSHGAIIAREKNMAMIAQFPIATIEDKKKLIIHSGNQVSILKNNVINWDFLEELKDDATIGNKALRLARLSHHRFNIPDSVILKHNTIERIYDLVSSSNETLLWQEYYEELKQLFDLITAQTPIIVRSSANVEDSPYYSYAGIFYSQSKITTVEEFISAICAAWNNMIKQHTLIKEYSGEKELTLHLILQSYIKGQAGGVLFTESKISGLMCIEIARNGVEDVTEGNGTTASLHINAQGQTFYEQGEKKILNQKQYRDLYQLGRQLETFFGKAQDVEWVISDQKLYILQCRDISDRGRLIKTFPTNRASNEI